MYQVKFTDQIYAQSLANYAARMQEEYSDDDIYSDEYSDDGKDQSGNGELSKQKHKRRSKNDNAGRTYQCGCGKSYLSYPALYTHIKQKHQGTAPDGTNNAQYHSGRGRGRPRKVRPENYAGEIVSMQDQNLQNMQGMQLHQISTLTKDLTNELLNQETANLKLVPFQTADRNQMFNALSWYSDKRNDDLYNCLANVYQVVGDSLKEIEEHQHQVEIRAGAGQSTQYLLLVPDQERAHFTIDQVLSLYLIDVSNLAERGIHFYKMVCCFVQLYRSCVNETLRQTFKGTNISTSSKSPDCVPLVANDFNTNYLQLKCNILDPEFAVSMTQHLCQWLYNRKFTNSRLEVI